MKFLTVVGARPQFIKAAALSRVLRRSHQEILLHTGQHYDHNMSTSFFQDLELPDPDYQLEVGSGSHAQQTASMLAGIENAILREQPDAVLVFGDTNSTLAGALSAAKLHIKVGHIEAGLRSFNRRMPEEINRVVVDHISDWLFCPSTRAADHLAREGVTNGVHVVGDLMAESLEHVSAGSSAILDTLQLTKRRYLLATIHRAENTDDPNRLAALLSGLGAIDEPVVLPLHPRTRKAMSEHALPSFSKIRFIDPVGYKDMIILQRDARLILTDSGGMQKEAYWLGVPCITLRDETEWTETVEAGWNLVAGTDIPRILEAVRTFAPPSTRPILYSDGTASQRIMQALERGC